MISALGATTKRGQRRTDLEAIKGKPQVRIAQLTNDFYNAAVGDTQTLLKASGVRSADATLIASDLKAVGAEVQKTVQGTQPGDIRKKLGRK